MPLGSRSRSTPPAEAASAPEVVPPTASEDLPAEPTGRLARWLPRLSGLTRFAYRTAWVSAASAAVLWWALVRGTLGLGGGAWLAALVVLVVLLIPAGAAWLLGLTLHDVLTLPETIRRSASAVASVSRDALRSDAARQRGGRILGAISALWAVRGFVLESKGAWAKAATAARLVRLAKLPFALGLVGLFLLNGVVIVLGLIALVVLVV